MTRDVSFGDASSCHHFQQTYSILGGEFQILYISTSISIKCVQLRISLSLADCGVEKNRCNDNTGDNGGIIATLNNQFAAIP